MVPATSSGAKPGRTIGAVPIVLFHHSGTVSARLEAEEIKQQRGAAEPGAPESKRAASFKGSSSRSSSTRTRLGSRSFACVARSTPPRGSTRLRSPVYPAGSMCGIAGIVKRDPEAPVDPAVLGRMCDAHRAPRPRRLGLWFGRGVGLGHRRLSIIDLSPAGQQPMCNEDGSVWVVFNGEIYNFAELRQELDARRATRSARAATPRRSSTSTRRRASAASSASHGMFAIAIWDERRRQARPGPRPRREEAAQVRRDRRRHRLRLGAEGDPRDRSRLRRGRARRHRRVLHVRLRAVAGDRSPRHPEAPARHTAWCGRTGARASSATGRSTTARSAS